MTQPSAAPKKILVPTDLSEQSWRVVRYGAALAHKSEAELHILHVFTVHAYDPVVAQSVLTGLRDAISAMESQIEEKLARQAARDVPERVRVVTAVRRSMSPYDAILSYAAEQDIDWIVMATAGRTGLNYVLLGSVTEKVVEYADRPILVVRAEDRDFVDTEGQVHLSRILVPTDFSEASEWAAPLARALAVRFGADIALAHVVKRGKDVRILSAVAPNPTNEENHIFDKLQEQSQRLFGDQVQVRLRVAIGPVPQALAELARQDAVDLVIMASQGEDSLMDRIVGSVAERMLRLSPCPVLVVKTSGQA